jgi:hypothetical protein
MAAEAVSMAEGEVEGLVPLGLMEHHQMEELAVLDLLGSMVPYALVGVEAQETVVLLALAVLVAAALAVLMLQSEQARLILEVVVVARMTALMLLLAAQAS